MNEEQFQNAVNAIGALAELVGLLRDALTRNEFSEDQIMYLCGIYMELILTRGE